ncbi:MAG: ComEA family DNA-binding protein [Candidatus Marinimicrobia bacterium]|jgi:competence protein ComEA|nr:ComEA family DNA-binding protein [Candidatus Neomarinimicrobiota bacterium]MDD5709025.1 ComEA family DNA-binding protein [Candidatus Neomarinimicrobiota bacterium]MDX9778407.1 ComEA family DNA-binding protein [bacterium]
MFTKKEKNIILIIALVLMAGALWSLLRTVVKKQRPLSSGDIRMESAFQREDEQRSESDLPLKPVDINTAGLMEIEALPYIGMEKAKALIAYREEHGPFSSPDELTRIKGIGPATVEKLKPFITLQP